ncbi:substrate-binding domain-containing protein [Mesorhizobium muleiense]|uniref:substrate-binding domain-containing protein n=1 Tax=Mesorhizobium muleiense TaxID=1004279 RepID=UPI001F3C387C|nr:substrate-binding domain-containing protein [Mesorhizobium muleiense]MCF6112145.1 substrate-binding domain-containing protein [Mesorhizobium muleiense]
MKILKIALAAGALPVAALGSAAQAQETIKLGYINKMGDHPWFVREVQGAKDKAKELGIELLVQDVQFDANLTVTTFDTYVGDGVKGIAIVVPDRALGPVVAEKAAAAKVPLIAVDDDIKTSDGKPVPYIGLNALDIGKKVGAEIASLVKEEGWETDLSRIKVGSVEDQKADTCMQRNKGAQEGLFAVYPELKANMISIPYDNTMVNAIDVVSTTLTGNPDAEKWIFFSCNDDGVLGSVRATENAGMDPKNVIGVGIDGSRTCEALGPGKPTGFRGTMWIDSAKSGAKAVEVLYDQIKNGKIMDEIYYVDPTLVNASNFDGLKPTLGCK